MEQESSNHFLVPIERQSVLLPVVSPAKALQVTARKKSGLMKLANWVMVHPVARLGTTAIAFAAGAFLSRRMPRGRLTVPSCIQRREDEVGEWFVTGVGLSIQSDCQQVSVWSIRHFYPRR